MNVTIKLSGFWNWGVPLIFMHFRLYCILLYCIVLYCIILYCIVLYLFIYIALLAVHTVANQNHLTPRRRRCSGTAEQLWAKNLLKVPTQ